MTKPNRVLATVVNMAVQRGALDLAKLQAQKDDGAFNNTDWNQFVELAGLQGRLRMADKPKGGDTTPPPEPETEPEAEAPEESSADLPSTDLTQEDFGVSMDTDRIEYLSLLIYKRLHAEGRLVGRGPLVEGAKAIISSAIREVIVEDNSLVAEQEKVS